MVKVNLYYQQDKIVKLEVSGHANFDQVGKDIVCAGISAVIFGTLNALDNLISKNEVKIIEAKNKITIDILKVTDDNQMILQTMFWQLKTISSQYTKNIIIKEVY
ncbi:MAG: ribosomal-processing cysteine protease Prp [Spiroplasma sp.]|nr:ribosomal-processing cysteine protease Prp [Spiroplasma sp.]